MRWAASCWVWTALVATTVAADSLPLTTMSVDPQSGSFGLCFYADCSKSLSISLYQISVNTMIDYMTNEVTSSTVIADFSTLDPVDLNGDGYNDAMITRSEDEAGKSDWSNATLYARACISAHCNPRPSNEAEFQRFLSSREDAVGVRIGIEHVDASNEEIVSAFESYDVARGALRLNLSLAISPLADQSDTLPMFGISFLVAAMENFSPTIITSTSTSVNGHMYLQRISFGSDMFLDLPVYATVNGADTSIYTAVKGQLSGNLEDLVLVTLMFGPVVNSVEYEAAFSSQTMTSVATETPAPAPTVLMDSQGDTIPTQLMTQARGVFGMCLDPTCSTDSTLSMGFAGLEMKGSIPMQLTKFANSPAFHFYSAARRGLLGTNAEVVSTYFQASIPQNPYRPARMFDGRSDPVLTTIVGLFLSNGSVDYGNTKIDVPRSAVKFTVNITDWVFASQSDTLELSMAVNLVRSDGLAVSIAQDYTADMVGTNYVLYLQGDTAIEFPAFAVTDSSNVVPVGIAFTRQDQSADTLIVTFTFPAFTKTLIYDPVMKANTTRPTGVPTPTPTTAIVLDKPKRKVDSWGVAGFLLGFLALVIIVSILQCCKKTRVKLDFSKIIP